MVSYRVSRRMAIPSGERWSFRLGRRRRRRRCGGRRVRQRPDLADADRRLSWPVRGRGRGVLRSGSAGCVPLDCDPRHTRYGSVLCGGLVGTSGPRRARSSAWDLRISAAWKAGLATSLGPSLLVAIAAMVVSLVALRMASGPSPAPVVMAMVGVGLSLASRGHAATAPPQWLTRSAVVLHGIGVAFGSAPSTPLTSMAATVEGAGRLGPVLRDWRAGRGRAGADRAFLAVVQLETFWALIETRYGLILPVKLALVVVLLTLAALNRFRLTPAMAADPGSARPLSLDPGRMGRGSAYSRRRGRLALHAAAALACGAAVTPLAVHIHSDDAMFQVLVSPGSGRHRQLRAPTDARRCQPACGQGGDPDPEPAGTRYRTDGTPGDARTDGYWHLRNVPFPIPAAGICASRPW